MQNIDLKTLKDRIENIHTLATVPTVAKRLLELVADQKVSLTEISSFVSSDPVLTTKILKMVNSPVYGFPGRISVVNQAVLLLGLNVVRGLLFGVTVFELMEKAMMGLREHSLGCAIVARLIARKKGLKDPEEASIYGLLHDIGKVVLVLHYPEQYEKLLAQAEKEGTTVYELESDYFSTTHATVGAWIAQEWNFPGALVDVIQYHHRPKQAKIKPLETAIVHLSDIILRAKGFGFAGDYSVPVIEPKAWETVDLTETDIKEILKEAEEALEETEDFAV